MADKKKKQVRYRVTDKRDYIVFGVTKVDAGNLVPENVKVEDWLVDAGWVKEE